MGQGFPICSATEVVRVLRRHGFSKVNQKGSHQKWRHSDGRQVIVADHGSKPIPIGTLKTQSSAPTISDNQLPNHSLHSHHSEDSLVEQPAIELFKKTRLDDDELPR